MENRIRVGVVDDHPLFREGVVSTLAAQDDMTIVGQGATADDAVRIARDHQPHVIVLDMNLPGDGLTALGTVASRYSSTSVLMLTVAADEERVTNAMRCGARGYLLKGVSGPGLVGAVRAVSQGELYVSPSLAARLLIRSGTDRAGRGESPDRFDDLTTREQQILALVSHGLSNKEIGSKLELTEKTVKHYLTSVLKKLHVRNRVDAALLACRRTPQPPQRAEPAERRFMSFAGSAGH
jgi:two-component system, NarL family, nitrate/nitrite response regulator NarL